MREPGTVICMQWLGCYSPLSTFLCSCHSLIHMCSLGVGNAAKNKMDQAHPMGDAYWWRQEMNSEINKQVIIN